MGLRIKTLIILGFTEKSDSYGEDSRKYRGGIA